MARLLLLAILVSTALGCRTTQTNAPPPPPPSGSALARAFGPKVAPPNKPVEVVKDEPKGPLKSDTVAVFADLQADAAFNNEELAPAERDRRLDEARSKFQKALEQDPKNVEALRGMGRLYTRLGDKERASATYQTALSYHPKNHALTHEAAMAFGRFEDWQTALNLWEHALSLDPANRKYPRMIGLAQVRLGNYEAGFASMVKVCSEAEARTIVARELLDAGQADAGRQQLELALKADPNYTLAQSALTQINGVQPASYR